LLTRRKKPIRGPSSIKIPDFFAHQWLSLANLAYAQHRVQLRRRINLQRMELGIACTDSDKIKGVSCNDLLSFSPIPFSSPSKRFLIPYSLAPIKARWNQNFPLPLFEPPPLSPPIRQVIKAGIYTCSITAREVSGGTSIQHPA
jgi:hypothetical protein